MSHKFLSFLLCFFSVYSAQAMHEKPYYVMEGSVDEREYYLKFFFFIPFHTVINLLNGYDRHEINGFEVSYNHNGRYFDPAKGPNWWEYFFEPIKLAHQKPETIIRLPNYKKSMLAHKALYELSLERRHELIKKYIRVRSHIQEKVTDFGQRNFHNRYVVGIDYHSSSAAFINPDTSFEIMAGKTRELINQLPLGKDYAIFLSTNDAAFLEYMRQEFGDAVHCLHVISQKFNVPLIEGEVSLLNGLLLSGVDTLIESGSYLSQAAIAFNPSVRVISLDKNWIIKDL